MLSLSDLFMSMLSMSGSWLSEGGRRIIWRSLCHLDLNKGNWRTVSHGLFSRLSISEYFSLTLLCCRRCERCVEVRRVIASVEDETATARCDGTCPSDHQSPRPGCLPDPGLPPGLRAAVPGPGRAPLTLRANYPELREMIRVPLYYIILSKPPS